MLTNLFSNDNNFVMPSPTVVSDRTNSPDLNPVDYRVWSALERNVYRERRFENTIELKEAILQEWEALLQAVINSAIDGFRCRVRLVIAENGQQIKKYLNE